MKKRGNFIRLVISCLLICIVFLGCEATIPEDVRVTYNCDVKVFSLNTKIKVSKNGDEIGEVTGDIFKFIEDPLTFKDKNGNAIAYAGDSYNFFAQDDHGIYLNNEFVYDMKGNVTFIGESYEIYDKDKSFVAKVSFNGSNTSGKMYNSSDVLIAEYTSGYLNKDFDIHIYYKCDIDENAIIMIFSSYYSDYAADSSEGHDDD